MVRLFWTVVIIALVVGGGYTYWAVRDLPSISTVVQEGVNPSKWTQVFGNDGTPILSYGKFHHKDVTLDEISPHFVDALLATEDRRFYGHFGIDPISIGRAVFVNLTKGRLSEGGSTLTQQLARNVFLSNERSMRRKVREAFLAVKLEQELTKEKILELYVNNIYFGEGAYGIHAACEIYFNKKPIDLTVEEAALLAGMPQAPSTYNPFLNPEAAKNRRNEVLANLFETRKLSKEELDKLQSKPFRLNPSGQEISTANRAPYFNQYVMAQAEELFGVDEQSFWQSGMKIYTTLDPYAQSLAARAVKNQSAIYGRTGKNRQAALLSLEVKTGAILAYVGGTGYSASQFDRVSNAVRAPGSLFKIFTYTTAIERGYAPNRVYLDEPIQAGEWRPKNYDGKHHGYMTLARALATSNNIIAVKVMHELDPKNVIQTAQRMGLGSFMENNLSLTLGSSGVTMMDITSAFAVLANEGVRTEPYAIEKIIDRYGNTIYEHYPMQKHVLDRETTDTMVALMQAVVQRGTGTAANIGRPVAGKTGTSDDNRDGWFIGFTPEIVTSVWVGNDDNSPIPGLTGGGLPATIWTAYMRPYVARKAITNFNLEYAQAIRDEDYVSYNLENLSEFEPDNPLAAAGRELPPGEATAELETDPLVDPEGTIEDPLVIEMANPDGTTPIGPLAPGQEPIRAGTGNVPIYPQTSPQDPADYPHNQTFPRTYPTTQQGSQPRGPQVIPIPQRRSPSTNEGIIPLPPTSQRNPQPDGYHQ